MPPTPRADTFSAFDPILAAADLAESPWQDGRYVPDWDLFCQLLAVPIGEGYASAQQSGRMAKAVDAWVAHELRRAGFPPDAVCPRARQPRFMPDELAPLERRLEDLFEVMADVEAKQAAAGGPTRVRPARFRNAITKLAREMPGRSDALVLGRFYVKQVDVLVSSWQRGPDVLVSTKTQFSSYLNNKNNRYEEAIGEATNLRDRYPMAAMGYGFLVRNNILEGGAFALLRDLLVRLRKPDGPFDATMLLVADWDDTTLALDSVQDAAPQLAAAPFFADLITAVTANTPVDVHQQVRLRKLGETPPGGLPPQKETGAVEG